MREWEYLEERRDKRLAAWMRSRGDAKEVSLSSCASDSLAILCQTSLWELSRSHVQEVQHSHEAWGVAQQALLALCLPRTNPL